MGHTKNTESQHALGVSSSYIIHPPGIDVTFFDLWALRLVSSVHRDVQLRILPVLRLLHVQRRVGFRKALARWLALLLLLVRHLLNLARLGDHWADDIVSILALYFALEVEDLGDFALEPLLLGLDVLDSEGYHSSPDLHSHSMLRLQPQFVL